MEYTGYISYEKFLKKYAPELLNITSADSVIEDDEEIIKDLIIASTYEMDADLDVRYDIAMLKNLNHPLLADMCARLTWYKLLERKGSVSASDKETFYDPVKYDLEQIAKNKKNVPGIGDKNNYNDVSYIFDPEEFTYNTMESYLGRTGGNRTDGTC